MNNALRLLLAALLMLVLIGAACRQMAIAQDVEWRERARDMKESANMGTHDFDFLVGDWMVLNRRLKARHVGSQDWDEFPGRSTMRPILGGQGNIDEIRFPTKGWSGVTMRIYSPATRQWSIYWVNSRDGTLQAPVVGGFAGPVGEFFGDDDDEGRRVRVRYRWTRDGSTIARWEQAFSTDGGKTWEVNWVMDFKRLR